MSSPRNKAPRLVGRGQPPLPTFWATTAQPPDFLGKCEILGKATLSACGLHPGQTCEEVGRLPADLSPPKPVVTWNADGTHTLGGEYPEDMRIAFSDVVKRHNGHLDSRKG
jgi:hypothetical protein